MAGAQPRQVGDQRLGHAVGEVGLLGIPRRDLEGQHGQRGETGGRFAVRRLVPLEDRHDGHTGDDRQRGEGAERVAPRRPAAPAVKRRARGAARGETGGIDRLERGHELGCGAVAARRLLGEAAGEHAAEGVGHRGRGGAGQSRGLVAQDGAHHLRRAPAGEGALAGQELMEHAAEGEDIGAGAGGLAPHLLRRHVADRAEDRPGGGERHLGAGLGHLTGARLAGELGETEVEDLDPPFLGHEDILGLEVAMHDPALVGRGEAARDLGGPLDRGAQRQARSGARAAGPGVGGALQAGPQRGARQQLGDEVARPLDHADVEDRQDVRMVERRGGARLLLEAAQPADVLADLERQDLDRDLAPEARVASAVDLSHPAFTQQVDDLVRTEPRSRPEPRRFRGELIRQGGSPRAR